MNICAAQYDGMIFDVDGTIVNNMHIHQAAWQNLMQSIESPSGREWSLQDVKREIWGKNEEIFERLFPRQFSIEQVNQLSNKKENHYIATYKNQISFIAGLEELLEQLKVNDIKLGIASAGPYICVDFVRQSLNLDRFFSVFIDADQVKFSKPDPEPFLVAASHLGVIPNKCLAFEDSPTGALSASKAGMETVVILTSHDQDEFASIEGIKGFIKDFTEIQVVAV